MREICCVEDCGKPVLVRGNKRYSRCETHQREFWTQDWHKRSAGGKPEKQPVPEGYKRCAHCGETFPATLEHFGKYGNKLNSYCRPCHNKRQRQYVNQEAVIPEFKKCASCQETKPAAEFSRKGKRLGSYCLRCHSLKNTKWKQDHQGSSTPRKLIVLDKAAGVFQRIIGGKVVQELPLSSFRRGAPNPITLKIFKAKYGYQIRVEK